MGSWSWAREGHMVALVVVVALVLLILGEQSDGKIHGSRVFNKKANESLSSNSSKSVQTSETIFERDEEDDESDDTDEQPSVYGAREDQPDGPQTSEATNPPCGRVPIYQKVFGRSINESFNSMEVGEQMDDYDEGEFRIINGIETVYGEWPWIVQVSICDFMDCSRKCTGTLLNDRWVITAGHCIVRAAKFYDVALAKHELLTTGKDEVSHRVDLAVRHPNYNLGNGMNGNDLGLMRLSKPVKFNDYIQPVCLIGGKVKDRVKYTHKRKCYTLGYGVYDNHGKYPLTLQKLQVEATDEKECNKERQNRVYPGSICIKPSSERKGASCYGDSGGPNTCYDPDTNQWVLHSTVSHGPTVCDRDEGDKWLTVSTDIGHHLDWIKRTMSGDN